MKKTIVLMLAIAGTCSASEPTAAGSLTNISLTTNQVVDISQYKLKSSEGWTLAITLTNWDVVKGPIGWLSASTNKDDASYTASYGTFGWSASGNDTFGQVTTFTNNSSGTAGGQGGYSEGYSESLEKAGDTTDLTFSTTVFLTGNNTGTVTLYEIDSPVTKNVVKTAETSGYLTTTGTNTINGLYIGNWAKNGVFQAGGTMDITFYNTALTVPQMKSLLVPEPTTATLSLLALAGLAARRRRK